MLSSRGISCNGLYTAVAVVTAAEQLTHVFTQSLCATPCSNGDWSQTSVDDSKLIRMCIPLIYEPWSTLAQAAYRTSFYTRTSGPDSPLLPPY